MEVINTVLPVFMVIVVGILLRRFRFFGEDFAKGLAKLVYYVALPALLFYKTAGSRFVFSHVATTYLVVLCGMVSCLIAAYAAAAAMKLGAAAKAAFVQGAFRGNLAYIGLPIVVYGAAYSQQSGGEQAGFIAALVLGMTVPVYNIVAVIVLLTAKQKLDGSAARRIIIETARNPLVISSIVGIAYSLAVGSLPPFVDRTFSALAQMALPLALLSIGASLAGPLRTGRLMPAAVASLIKVALAPLVGLLILTLLGASGEQRLAAMVFLACPTAVSSYIYSQQLNADEQLSASIVLLSTLFSIVSLSVAVLVG